MKTLLPIQAIAWDLDGTLADTAADLTSALNYVRERHRLEPMAVHEVRNLVGDGARALVKRGMNPPNEATAQAHVDLFLEYYFDHCCDSVRLMPGVAELLNSATHLRHAIATNKPMRFTRPIIERLDLARWIKVAYGPDPTVQRKPDPDMLLRICTDFSIKPGALLMVGDSSNDILAAHAAGAQSCGVGYGYQPADAICAAEPDFFIDHPRELSALLPPAAPSPKR